MDANFFGSADSDSKALILNRKKIISNKNDKTNKKSLAISNNFYICNISVEMHGIIVVMLFTCGLMCFCILWLCKVKLLNFFNVIAD